jgi:hypothetical protein
MIGAAFDSGGPGAGASGRVPGSRRLAGASASPAEPGSYNGQDADDDGIAGDDQAAGED